MKKIFIFLGVLLAACSLAGTSEWTNNLLSLKNANFVTDSSGTITMDGFTFTLEVVHSPLTAVYRVHIGEFTNKESESIGFVRFDIVESSLTDSRIRESLIRYQIKSTPEDALYAPRMSSDTIIAIPPDVINMRFLRTMGNITYRELQTNGAGAGAVAAVINDIPPQILYMQGVKSADGTNIFFHEILYKLLAANKIPDAYYLNAQWRFVKALNDKQGVYQKVTLARYDPGPDFYNTDPLRPLAEKPPVPSVENVFIGVQHKTDDGLYFFYPSPTGFYTSANDVSFVGGISVKVARPTNINDTI